MQKQDFRDLQDYGAVVGFTARFRNPEILLIPEILRILSSQCPSRGARSLRDQTFLPAKNSHMARLPFANLTVDVRNRPFP
jgi:hypothetical protein